jgi:1-acyl-sn-glycerol-3-phosphate acyltransferase
LRVENVPDLERRGPVILAPNHSSFLDPVVLQLVSPVHLNFLMTEVFYRVRWQAWLYRLWGAIPIPEEGSAAGALKRALGVIRSGDPVVIFPEGRISPDGYLQEGRGGVVTLISRARVPVIPVAILGTHRVLPRSARLPRPGRIVVRFGEPIVPEAIPRGRRAAEYLERIMDALAELGAPRRDAARRAGP